MIYMEAFARKGASSDVIALLACFLSGRTVRVKVGEARSNPRSVNAGAPQGSVLNSYLFNIGIPVQEISNLSHRVLAVGLIKCGSKETAIISAYMDLKAKPITEQLQAAIDYCKNKDYSIFLTANTKNSISLILYSVSYAINECISGWCTIFLLRRPLSRQGRPTGIRRTGSASSAPGAGVY